MVENLCGCPHSGANMQPWSGTISVLYGDSSARVSDAFLSLYQLTMFANIYASPFSSPRCGSEVHR